ncbi:hypothetical protein RB7127 [Rhodopirellula baltica SH 1]|uniref:Uncharacterized protein n=1 Tax=Rhodopirellula baltica (strain DSM 10527 / NCIMB 13988 / SH1) TaxID=243090 RepID=Q7UP68_RHOBA|nr:hypothetical protein RB7127 [Rhodopirellula baltica SH 1]
MRTVLDCVHFRSSSDRWVVGRFSECAQILQFNCSQRIFHSTPASRHRQTQKQLFVVQ